MGKGRRERISPIWPETADLVTALMRRQPRRPDEPIFVNRYGEPLTASGFRFRLRQYVDAAAKAVPTIFKKRVTPHVFDTRPRSTSSLRAWTSRSFEAGSAMRNWIRPTIAHRRIWRPSERPWSRLIQNCGQRSRQGGNGKRICWRGSIHLTRGVTIFGDVRPLDTYTM
jgi:hypothetical protein